MKPCTHPEDIAVFKKKYVRLSGLDIPDDFLAQSDVYVFRHRGQIVGGYIIANLKPYRTLEKFANDENRPDLEARLARSECSELCCFWIDRAYRKKKLLTIYYWLLMAWKTSRQKEKFTIYGTNSRGLANLYGYPRKALLYHTDVVDGKETFIFLAKSKDVFWGTLEIMRSRLGLLPKFRAYHHKPKLQQHLYYELSK